MYNNGILAAYFTHHFLIILKNGSQSKKKKPTLWNSQHKPSPNTTALRTWSREKKSLINASLAPLFPSVQQPILIVVVVVLNLDHLRPFYKSISWKNRTPINRAHHQIDQMYNTWFQTLYFFNQVTCLAQNQSDLGHISHLTEIRPSSGVNSNYELSHNIYQMRTSSIDWSNVISTILTSLMDISPSGLRPVDWTIRIERYTS